MYVSYLTKFPLAFRAFAVSVIVLTVLAGGCGNGESSTVVVYEGAATASADSAMNILTGDITIEDAFELSHIPSSRVLVQLEDISIADLPPRVIAEQMYEYVTTLPLSYELKWTGKLDPENHYSVAASVYDSSGELIFWTDSIVPVSPGDTNVDFHVVSVYLSP